MSSEPSLQFSLDPHDYDRQTCAGVEWLIRTLAVAEARVAAGEGEAAWGALPFRLVPMEGTAAGEGGKGPKLAVPHVPSRGLRWQVNERRLMTFARFGDRDHPSDATTGASATGLFLSTTQRRRMLGALCDVVPEWGFRPRKGFESYNSPEFVEVLKAQVPREPQAVRTAVELILTVPVRAADAFQAVLLIRHQHELYVLSQEYPEVLDLVYAHPRVMALIASHLREHCSWTADERARWVGLLRTGLVDTLAAMGLPRTWAMVSIIDRLEMGEQDLNVARRFLTHPRFTVDVARALASRAVLLRTEELGMVLVLLARGVTPKLAASLVSRKVDLPLPACEPLEMESHLARNPSFAEKVDLWVARGGRPEVIHAKPAALEMPWCPSIPREVAGWRRADSERELRAVQGRFGNCLLNYLKRACEGEVVVFFREPDTLFDQPIVVLLDGPATDTPGRALAAGVPHGTAISLTKAVRVVSHCDSLWWSLAGRPLVPLEEEVLINSLVPGQKGFQWSLVKPGRAALKRALGSFGVAPTLRQVPVT